MSASREVTDQAFWDSSILSLESPHILQSWTWGETKEQTGWRARRLLWVREGAPVAAAAVLVRPLRPGFPLAVAYVPKGPLLDWSDVELTATVLGEIEATARRLHAFFVKIDPDLRADGAEGQAMIRLLIRRGWRFSAEQIQFRNTMVSHLAGDESSLLAAMKPKWRYNIRLAERRGLAVRDGGIPDLNAFYRMYQETGLRDGFLVRPLVYYRHVWERFLGQGLAHLLLAQVDGRDVAGLMLFRFGPTAWYFYGASTAQARDLMPNHALQWAALRWAKAAGCLRYDWWGAPDALVEEDPMWGVYRFKAGFGGEFIPSIGAWDFPTGRLMYWLYVALMPRLLGLARKRHHSQSSNGPPDTIG